ncbi:hypothetical protein Tco_0563745, partial [Tanacetum coccineum]
FQNPFYLKKAQQLEPNLYVGDIIEKTIPIVIPDSEETLLLAEESHFETRFVPQTELSAEQAFWSQNLVNTLEPIPSSRPTIVEKEPHPHLSLRVRGVDELSEVQNVFHQMEQAVEQHLEKCLKLETELLNKKDFVEKEIYDKLFKSFTTLEKHCISLEVDIQHNQEIFQRDNYVSNQSAPSFDQLFELNELKAQSQEKDNVIKKLKERIKSLSGTGHVQHSKLNANSKLKCVKCNGCMLFDNHDLCDLDFINNVNAHKKSKSVKKSSKRKVWKPTGNVFKNIGYIWRPTGQTFTIVGNACPLTWITTTFKVPLRKLTALENETPKPVVTLVYSRKPRKSQTNVPVSKSKVLKSVFANKKEPSQSWGSIVFDVPSSSLNECRSSKLFSGIWTPAAPSI